MAQETKIELKLGWVFKMGLLDETWWVFGYVPRCLNLIYSIQVGLAVSH